MIRTFTIINANGQELLLDLFNPDDTGIVVMSVDGLGQVQSNMNFVDLAGCNYSKLTNKRLLKRNVIFDLKFIKSDTEETEELVDQFFNTGEPIKVIVKTDKKELFFTGFTESNEPTIFSTGPDGTGARISVVCPDPYLYDLGDSSTTFDAIEPLFEFPFCDGEEDQIQFGEIRIIKDRSIYYKGDESVGIVIVIHALGIIKDLVIYNLDTNEKIGINDTALQTITGSGIVRGDDIIISTLDSQKTATLIRDGNSINIINALVKNPRPDWFKLSHGDNLFTYSASEGVYHVALDIKYNNVYKGI